jgi:hypothetical protein
MSHPVRLQLERPVEPRDRLSAFARPLLILPHTLLVGGPFVGLGAGGLRWGALGVLAATIGFLDWVAILFTGHPIAGLQGLKRLYMQWRTRVLVYGSFLRDEYPPFGEGPYPALLELPDEPADRDRWVVGFRPILVIPHLLVSLVLLIACLVTTIWSWLVLSTSGRQSEAVWTFNRDVVAYVLRFEAYALLVHDVFPPFALTERSEVATSAGPA